MKKKSFLKIILKKTQKNHFFSCLNIFELFLKEMKKIRVKILIQKVDRGVCIDGFAFLQGWKKCSTMGDEL